MSEPTIKAITTCYKGYRFRSRLEARWAVFYDALGVKWLYEPEGFDFGGGAKYLPDFWLPDLKCWIEIKARKPTSKENELAAFLAQHTQKPVYVFQCPEISLETDRGAYVEIAEVFKPDKEHGYVWDNHQSWCECSSCGRFGIMFEARSDRLPCKIPDRYDSEDRVRTERPICPRSSLGDRGHNGESPRLIAARNAARGARFEHGESGRPVNLDQHRAQRRPIVYISGPMTGVPEFNYPAFHAAEAQLRELGYEVINPARRFGGDVTRPRAEYMRADIEDVLKADAVVVLDGWERSKGARLEAMVAQEIGIPVIDTGSAFIALYLPSSPAASVPVRGGR